jgi:hypothetical protein
VVQCASGWLVGLVREILTWFQASSSQPFNKEKGFTWGEIDEAAWMGVNFADSQAMVFYE